MRINILILAALVFGTLGLYARVARFDFVNFDDGEYVYENPRVLSGLTSSSISWAFTGICSSNWHPLTMLSHELDIQLFGKRPGLMHAENAILHAANAALLFWLLVTMTDRRWASAWVAAMFAWHPLHVESVAWISERKDVLSTLFALLSLLFYVRHVQRADRRAFWMSVVMLGLGLLAKPMVVTLPCVMLLLDLWPLQRRERFVALIREKIPMFALIAISALVTYLAQSSGRAVAPLDRMPLSARLANIVTSYAIYLRQMVVPRDLAIFYPLSVHVAGPIPRWQIATSVAVLVLITALVVLARREPWLRVGWLWYLGTLVPVIGFVQVGSQAHADRYTYVPSIGIFIAVAWTCGWIVARWRPWRVPIATFAVASLIGAATLSWRQIGTWQNSITVMQHAVDVVPNNFLAMGSLAQAYDDVGDHAKAADWYHKTLEIRPNDATALNNLGVQAAEQHDDDRAYKLFRDALWADPSYAPTYFNYGNLLLRKQRLDDAIQAYRAGMKIDPEDAAIQNSLARALARQGNLKEAIPLWRSAVSIDPNLASAHAGLGNALLLSSQTVEGIHELCESVQIQPDDAETLSQLAWTLATHPNPLYQNATEAQQLAKRAVELTHGTDAIALDTLAAAEARAGKFDDAIADAKKAEALIEAQPDKTLLPQIRTRIKLYQSHEPYTSGQ